MFCNKILMNKHLSNTGAEIYEKRTRINKKERAKARDNEKV